MSASNASTVVLKAQKNCPKATPLKGARGDTSGKNFGAVSPVATVAAPARPASMRSGRRLNQVAAADHDASKLSLVAK